MKLHRRKHAPDASAALSIDLRDAPAAVPSEIVDIGPGGSFDLRVHPVTKVINGSTFGMLSYNGSIPGPTLRVQQGSEIFVNVVNETTMETTVHWHGLRLENPYDGVPHETQAPIPPGGRYMHRLTFPDAGLFWYHPHMREDYAQEMGLYANIIVEPIDSAYWPAVDQDIVFTLDDILIEDGVLTPFDPHTANFVAMGRFGNVLLIGGETEQLRTIEKGSVVRFWLTNTANTRVFKVKLPGCRMKLVGGDEGHYEHERWVEEIVIAPSERAVVDVLFDSEGTFHLEHETPGKTHRLSTLLVVAGGSAPGSEASFSVLRVNNDMVALRELIAAHRDRPPDKTLALVAEMDFEEPSGETAGYSCPMHPDVVRDEPGRCPKCFMKLMPMAATGDSGDTPHHSHDHGEEMADGVEWEDLMFEVNRKTTPENMRWKAIDRDSGAANAEIDWTFDLGDQVKIRLVNEMESDHPMHHPFHIHGERFLILARNGVEETSLVWKDTVLLRTGEVVDILMDASNPGLWMAHCHIAEHMESGMMFSFRVKAS